MGFGEFIRKVRKRGKFTQAQFAVELEVTPETVSRWETDDMVPSPEKFELMLKPYGVTLKQCLRFPDETITDDQIQMVMNAIRNRLDQGAATAEHKGNLIPNEKKRGPSK